MEEGEGQLPEFGHQLSNNLILSESPPRLGAAALELPQLEARWSSPSLNLTRSRSAQRAETNDRSSDEFSTLVTVLGRSGRARMWSTNCSKLFSMWSEWRVLQERNATSEESHTRTERRLSTQTRSDRMVRTDVWSKHGQSMHLINLEFEDAGTELEFQKDFVRRNKRCVRYSVLILSLFYCVSAVMYHLGGWEFFHGTWLCKWQSICYAVQYLQIRGDESFVKKQLPHVTFFYAFVQAVLLGIFIIFELTKEGYDCEHHGKNINQSFVVNVAINTLVAFLFLRLRSIYFMWLNALLVLSYLLKYIYLAVNYQGLSCVPSNAQVRHVVMLSLVLILFQYTHEVSERKDFVQAAMVCKENGIANDLLHNILPGPVIEQLKSVEGRHAIAQHYDAVTVLFADVVSFTTMSAQISAPALVELLNRMFQCFDSIAERNGVEKIKTIGDCYMCAAGLPLPSPQHAKQIARFGIQMLEAVASGEFQNPATGEPLQVRAGLHSGPAVAGVIGNNKFAYDLWGDAVNTASRMESHGEALRLHCSEASYELLKDEFVCAPRAKMKVKGKGEMQTYFVVAERDVPLSRSSGARRSSAPAYSVYTDSRVSSKTSPSSPNTDANGCATGAYDIDAAWSRASVDRERLPTAALIDMVEDCRSSSGSGSTNKMKHLRASVGNTTRTLTKLTRKVSSLGFGIEDSPRQDASRRYGSADVLDNSGRDARQVPRPILRRATMGSTISARNGDYGLGQPQRQRASTTSYAPQPPRFQGNSLPLPSPKAQGR